MNENENKEVIPVSDTTSNQEVISEQQNTISVDSPQNPEVVPAPEVNPEVVPAGDAVTTQEVTPAPVAEQPAAVQTEEVNQNIEVQPVQENSTNQTSSDNSTMNDNKGPSTFAKIMTVLLFGGLFAFVYFLGDITEYINLKKAEKSSMEITNGRLLCTNEKTTDNLNIQLSVVFKFENKGIISLEHVTTSTGDKIKDKEELAELNNNCKLLKEEITDYDGVSVVCSLSNGTSVVKQNFDYSQLDASKVTAAFAEAGGVYPNFKYKDDINSVESKMIASDYTCEKTSS